MSKASIGFSAAWLLAAAIAASPAAAQDGGMSDLHAKVRIGKKTCFADHYHYGSSGGLATRKVAEREAIASWAGFVAWEYGNAWSSYTLAVNKQMECGNSGGGWACSVSAIPCRKR